MSNYVIVGGELYHHGVKGQKWGVRRYQKKDGSLTVAGKRRYTPIIEGKLKAEKHANEARREAYKALNASPKKHSQFQYQLTAEKAAMAARKKSIIEQKEANKQARAEAKAAKEADGGKRITKRDAAVAGAHLAKNILSGVMGNTVYKTLSGHGMSNTQARGAAIATTMITGYFGHQALESIIPIEPKR